MADCKRCHYEEEITLDLEDDCDPDSDSNSDTGQVNNDEYESEADNEGEYQKNDIEARHLTEYSKEFMQKVVNYADEKDRNGKRRLTWKSVHNRFKALPDQAYVSRFRQYLAHQDTKRQKIHSVAEIVYKRFIIAREKFLPIHDIDLHRITLEAAHELDLENFVASNHWLSNFKTRHSIVSRRITNIVTHHEVKKH